MMAERQVFVARERELSQLDAFLKLALAGQGQVCFVTGEAGSGKTTLVTEFGRRAQEQDKNLLVAVGQSNAQTGIGDPYLPFREALAMLTGDASVQQAARRIGPQNVHRLRAGVARSVQVLVEAAPELVGVLVPGGRLLGEVGKAVVHKTGWMDKLELLAKKPAAPSVEQSRIFEQYTAYLQQLSVKTPLILLLDDLQWSDAASIELLFHLGRRIGESRVLIVGAYRPEEVALGRGGERHPLEKVLAEFMHYFGDIWLDLGQAEEAEHRQFVSALLETQPNRLGEEFREALFQHTAGQALFTVELLRDMQERGDIVRDEEGQLVESPSLDWGAVPARVEGVIEERIGRLEEQLREILSVASVEGQDFTAQVVGRVQDIGERQLLRELSQELGKRHRLVEERGEVQVGRQRVLSPYQFAHTLFQQYLYNDLSAGERRLLHREVAEVLEELYEGNTEEIAVQLARHFELAGIDDKAIEYLLQVGDRARGLYAHREAIDHYQRALALLEERGECDRAARTLMKLGLTYQNAFDFQAARQAYDEGFLLWEQAAKTESPDRPLPAPHGLRVALVEPPTLDPGLAYDVGSHVAIDQLFSGLVELSPEMGVTPDVARSWEMLDEGRKYIFHLWDDVRWSDGVQVTAGDFEYAWKRVLDPATPSQVGSVLYDIKEARAYHKGHVSDPDLIGVQAVDESTLVVELEGPTSYFPHLLTFSPTFPVPRHVVETHGEAWTEEGNLVTNGPFRLLAWERGESMLLERNPTYHRRMKGNLQQVELWFRATEPAGWLQLYEDNRLEVLFFELLPLTDWERARQRHAGEYVSVPSLETYYVGFGVRRPPFDDLRVRRAFALATDRESLAHVTLRGYAFPATGGYVPPGMPGHSPGIGLPYDPEQARLLLADAGYPGGQGFPELEVFTAGTPLEVSTVENLQTQWLHNLGVEITLKHLNWGEMLDRLSREDPHMWSMGWGADYPDPDNFLRVGQWRPTGGWRNELYDRLIEGARRGTDQGERIGMYQQAELILVQEAPILPLYHFRSHLLVKPWVRRYPTSPMKLWFFKDVIIEPH
jgi:ABC-type oligopeptide transport system substrate-binding subunit